jgi:hypothetical protein
MVCDNLLNIPDKLRFDSRPDIIEGIVEYCDFNFQFILTLPVCSTMYFHSRRSHWTVLAERKPLLPTILTGKLVCIVKLHL